MNLSTNKIVHSLEQINIEELHKQIISFDLFDTIIKRKYLLVNEVHDTVSAFALARLGRYENSKPGQFTLTRYNVGNFLKTSPHARMEEPALPVVWEHVFASFRDRSQDDAAIIDDLIAFEFDLEFQNLELVPGARELLTRLRAAGKRLVAITDMYFDQAQIEKILDKLGILTFFEKVYVSAEIGLTKQTGRLFKHVLDDLGVSASELHHLGDNPHSDIAMARRVGIDATRVDQQARLHVERPAFGRRPDIRHEISDLIKLFLFQVLIKALNNKTGHLYFLSRDGLLLHEVLKRWDAPLVRRYFDRFPRSDLFMGRAISCWLALNFQGEWLTQAIGFAFWLCHGRASPRQISALFGIDGVPEGLDDKPYDSASDTTAVVDAYRKAGLSDAIRAAILAKRRIAEDYLNGVGMFSSRHVTLCDIGYSGTVARDLNSFFLQESLRPGAPPPPKIELDLLSSNANYGQNAVLSQPYVNFGNRIILPADRLPNSLSDSFAWLEVFFKHPTFGPLRGYVRDGQRVEPDYDVAPAGPESHPGAALLDASEPRPQDIVLLWMASQELWDPFIDPLTARFAAPDMALVRQMQSEIYEDDAVSGRKRSVVLTRPDLAATEIYQIAKRTDYWIPGSILASAQKQRDAETEAGPPGAASGQPPVAAGGASGTRPTGLRALGRLLKAGTIGRTVGDRLRRGRPRAGEPAIDYPFYRTYYADLAALDDPALRRHYVEFGRDEHRFARPEELIADLEAKHAPLPADFDAQAYRRLHGDLPFAHDWQLKAHYLSFGRAEGRRYRSDEGLVEGEFDDLLHSGALRLSAAEAAAWQRGVPVSKLVFDRADIAPGPWLGLLHLGEFQALNHEWAGRLRSRAHAVHAFLEGGLARLAPLSLGARFDPDDYARRHPDLAKAAPETAYRHWLQHGAGQGEAGSEEDRLFQLTGARSYPSAFRHDLFAERHLAGTEDGEADRDLDRVALLALFCDGAYTAFTDLVEGEGAARLWEVVGRRARERGQIDGARRAYENALACGDASGRLLHRLGDIAVAQHRLHDALACYERGLAAPSPNRWSSVNGARVAADLGYFEKALDIVRSGSAAWAGREPWRRARDHVYRAWYEQACSAGSEAASSLAVCARLAGLIDEETAATRPLADPDGPVVILTDGEPSDRPADHAARFSAAVEAAFGRASRVFPIAEAGAFAAALPGASRAIVHEVRPRPSVVRALRTARALGVPTLYWAGSADGEDVPAFRDPAVSRRLTALLACPLARYAMSLCDEGVATLPAAAAILERETAGHRARIVGRLARAARRERAASPSSTLIVRLPARTEDGGRSLERAWSVIETLLTQRPAVSVIVDATAVPPRALRRFGPRLRSADLCATDATAVWLAREAGGFASFVPEAAEADRTFPLGSCEMALWGLPVLEVGETAPARSGALRRRAPDALSGLLRFVDEPSRRDEAGRQARAAFAARFLADTPAPPPTAPPAPARPRLLLVNVFFPPQTTGGATRVVKDNVDFLLDRHPDAFELSVLTGDDQNDADGARRLDVYRGVPVMRVATPQEVDMDWRPHNAAVLRHAREALRVFKPDLVHIHCLQRLTVAVAQACREAGIPFIVTLHDAWWLSDYSFLVDEDGRLAMPGPELLAQPHSARIGLTESVARGTQLRDALGAAALRLSVSEPFAAIYRACGFEVEVCANGVSRLEPAERAEAGPRVRLAHLGGTQGHKGAYLVETVLRRNTFRNLSLTLVDHFRDGDDVAQTVWGTTPVTIVGTVASDAIAEVYARTDVLLAPSIWPESFGLVAREALSAGAWVVASDLGAMGEAVVEGRNGFVIDVSSPDALAEVLRRIDDDPDTYRRPPPLRTPLRTVDDQSRDLVAIYRRLLDRGGRYGLSP